MKDNMIKSGLTAVSAIGFLLLGSCSSHKPNDAIFNSRQGHMPAPAISGSNVSVTKPVVQPDSGQPILLNDNTSPGSGIIIDDSAPVIQPGPVNPPVNVSKMSYKVKKNESLWSIARAHGVSRHDLARENGLSPEAKLKLNQNLTLPAGARYVPPANRPPIKPRAATGGNQKYKVRKGDSLSVIAHRYKTSVSALKAANNLKSNTIRVNQTLTIPNKNAPRNGSGTSRTKAPSGKASGNLYTVRKGDTLSEIAQKNGTTTKAIMQANGLKNHNIFIGKKLVIPGYKGSGSSSKPKKPSNLQEEIKNDLFGDKKDKMPAKDKVETDNEVDNPFADKPSKDDKTEVKTEPKKTTMKTMDVLVVESDTLETLAKDFMTTVELIKDANPGVSGNEDLKPGMVLKVPRGN